MKRGPGEGMMKDRVSEIVVYYKLRQDECPDLFENLEAVPKGQPRANRLKVLALSGFNAERLIRGNAEQSAVRAAPKPPSSDTSILSDLIEGRVEQ